MLSWHIKHYQYGKFANYNTGNAIATLITITGTVIGKITIPVMYHLTKMPLLEKYSGFKYNTSNENLPVW